MHKYVRILDGNQGKDLEAPAVYTEAPKMKKSAEHVELKRVHISIK